MLPAYYVSPKKLLKVAFAVAEIGENPDQEAVQNFTGFNNRVVREAIKIGEELSLFIEEENDLGYNLDSGYKRDLSIFSPSDRSLILYDALLHYQPFMQYISYLNTGYTPTEAARQVNTVTKIASGHEYVEKYFNRYGEYAGALSVNDEVKIEIDSGTLPGNPSEPIDRLQESLASEAEVRLYLETLLGEEMAGELPVDIMDQLVGAFTAYASDPRDSVTEAGRAVEDFLRWMGNEKGSQNRDYAGATGITPLANHLKGDSLITEIHKKNLQSLGSCRNKAAHGRSSGTMNRWKISEEGALSITLNSVITIRSVYHFIEADESLL